MNGLTALSTAVCGAASSALVVGLAAFAFAHVDRTPEPAPPWHSYRAEIERMSAIAYTTETLRALATDEAILSSHCDGDFGPLFGPTTLDRASVLELLREPAVDVIVGQVVVSGELDRAVARRYIRRQVPALARCYQGTMAIDGPLGELTTRFSIDAAGKASAARAEGLDPALARCVESVLAEIQLQVAPASASEIRVPLTFARHRHALTYAEAVRCEQLRWMPVSMQADFDPVLTRRCGL